MIRYLWAALLLLVSVTAASAQGSSVHLECLTGTTPPWATCSTDHPLPISGTFTASVFGGTVTTGTPISVTTGGVTGTLPAGAVVVVSNVGATNNAYCKLGASATTSDQLIAPSSWFSFTVGSATQLTCITSTSTTTVNMVGGAGLPSGAGGGGGGGGSAITNYALETGGNLASVLTGTGATGTGSQRVTVATDSATVAGSASLPTGTNTIGLVKQTDGTTTVLTDPCQGNTKSYLAITATTSLVKVIATGVSAKKIYICQLILTTTAANNVAVFEANTGSVCATNPVAVYGAGTTVATAANGFPFPANGGVSLGSGGYSVAQTSVNANDLCIGTSAATPLTGGVLYVTQ